jgi:NAD(P)H-dependent FMN reductase
VILGSTRQGRQGENVARWLMRQLARWPGAEFALVDLRDCPLPFFDHPLPPASGQYAPEARRWAQTVASGDGYIIVTPEYNHGYPAVLKNALDHVYGEWNRKPVAFVSYGGAAAGYRAAEQLREVVVELQMAPMRAQVGIPLVWMAFDAGGEPRQPGLDRAVTGMVDDLLWWTRPQGGAGRRPPGNGLSGGGKGATGTHTRTETSDRGRSCAGHQQTKGEP